MHAPSTRARHDLDRLTESIIGSAQRVHSALGPGFLERVYERALEIELIDNGLVADRQREFPVRYKERVVGTYYADIVVDAAVVVEVKAVDDLHVSHRAQCLNYLRASGLRVGLLLNFGGRSLEVGRVVNRF